MDTHENGRRCIDDRNFFKSNEISRGVETKPVVFLGQEHPEETEVAHFFYKRRLEVRACVPVGDERRDFLSGELSREILYLALFFGQVQKVGRHLLIAVETAAGLSAEPSGGNVLSKE